MATLGRGWQPLQLSSGAAASSRALSLAQLREACAGTPRVRCAARVMTCPCHAGRRRGLPVPQHDLWPGPLPVDRQPHDQLPPGKGKRVCARWRPQPAPAAILLGLHASGPGRAASLPRNQVAPCMWTVSQQALLSGHAGQHMPSCRHSLTPLLQAQQPTSFVGEVAPGGWAPIPNGCGLIATAPVGAATLPCCPAPAPAPANHPTVSRPSRVCASAGACRLKRMARRLRSPSVASSSLSWSATSSRKLAP